MPSTKPSVASSSTFKAEAHRQSLLVARSPTEAEDQAFLDAISEFSSDAIERGLADAAAGRTRPAEEVFDRLEAKYRAQADE